jgi:CubicO group peptidase (beta-lactamase class C family)
VLQGIVQLYALKGNGMKNPGFFNHRISQKLAQLLLLALITISQAAWAAESAAGTFIGKVNEYMQAAERVHGFSGSILVAHDGTPLVSEGYGFANIELGVPNSPETVYLLGSITKQFTGMAIAMLQEEGKLQVGDPACKYLENCPQTWADITIRQMLWHTSGIPSYTGFPEFAARTVSPIDTPQMMDMLRDRPLDFAPGTDQSYSNSGYFLLGSIIESVSGKTYADFLDERIFTPLGMEHSAYDVPDEIIKNRAAGYVRRNGELFNALYTDMTIPFAAGALHSTTGDLLLWDQALYTEKLVTSESLKEIFTPNEPGDGYGFGWSIGKRFDKLLIAHGGGIYGFSTHIARFPDDGVTVIVLSNIEGAPSGKIAYDLAAIYFGEEYTIPVEQQAVVLDPAILQSYVGEYRVNDELSVVITLVGENLVAELGGRSTFGLLAASETEFFSRDVDLRLAFERSESGEVTAFVLNPGPNGTTATKVK